MPLLDLALLSYLTSYCVQSTYILEYVSGFCSLCPRTSPQTQVQNTEDYGVKLVQYSIVINLTGDANNSLVQVWR